MQETKFRGKRKDGVWIEGYYCKWQNRHYIAPDPHESGFSGGEIISYDIAGFFEVDPETVGQFTGLSDKKGVEIYEGDIVQFDVVNPIWDGEKHEVKEHRPETWRRVVEYKAPKFWIHWYPEKLEVIGNCTDNPDLITNH